MFSGFRVLEFRVLGFGGSETLSPKPQTPNPKP